MWTKEQIKALEFNNKDMLVSASAGSGKTTVMVEKILKYLETKSITSIIVLTFTKASALDMREKLTKKLSALVRQGGENARHYRDQLNLLPFAYIGTIDSICGQIYKRYFEELGTPPNLEMLDNEESEALRSRAIDDVFTELIKADDSGFNELSNLYADTKSFNGLKKTIEIFLTFLSAQENPKGYLEFAKNEASKGFLSTDLALKEMDSLRIRAKKLRRALDELYGDLKVSGMVEKHYNAFLKKLDDMEDLRSKIEHARNEDFNECVMGLKMMVNMPSSKITQEDYVVFRAKAEPINQVLKDLIADAKSIFGKSTETLIKEDEENKRLVCELLDVVEKVRERHLLYKQEEGKSDFEDVERYVLEIFENEKMREEFSRSIDHVFLDEYQDVNRLQEAIFQKISRGNLFMVGDVKQAIYGFREAEPQIFLDKYQLYQMDDDAGENRPLTKNFRSEQEVLTFIDKVFSEVMTPEMGGVNYREGHTFGSAGMQNEGESTLSDVEVALFTPEERKVSDPDTEIYSVLRGKKKCSKEREQDLYIASKILSIVGKEEIRDENVEGGLRPIRYSDVSVLYRSKAGVEALTKIFDKYGIPYVAEGMEGLSGSNDVDAINCYLRVVDNYKQDKYLAGAMLSRMGGFNERELANVRAWQFNPKAFFHEAVWNYDGDPTLKEKISLFKAQLERHRRMSSFVDVPTLIGKIVTETGYLNSLLAEGKKARVEVYNSFVHLLRTKKFARNLQAYVEFLDSGVELEIPSQFNADDTVTIMTAHRSKGLEFPVVFVARAGRKMKKTSSDPIILNAEHGVGINTFDEKESKYEKSARRVALEKAILKKSKDEEVRIMYVAFTRAKYRLYVTGSVKADLEKPATEWESASDYESFMEWVAYSARCNPSVKIEVDPGIVGLEEVLGEGVESKANGEALEFLNYAYGESTTLSNKYTVTQINAKASDKTEHFGTLGAQSIEDGVAYHKIMEEIDFNNCSREEVEALIAKHVKEGIIKEGQVNPDYITRIVAHPIFDYARSGSWMAEREFMYYAPACEVLEGVTSTDKTLVQGIMDLIIEGEKNYLVDYKVSSAPIEVLRNRYATQIALYAKAYEEITGKKLDGKAVVVLNRGEVIEF